MLPPNELYEFLKQEDLTFFTGVPDSTFKEFISILGDNQIRACNECEALAIASGYHLATGKIGIVYMQNSGFGKTINPITSLADKEVYSIPLILMIGWRGEPDKTDEPQHKKMGRITLPLLDKLEIPYRILPDNLEEAKETIKLIKQEAIKTQAPVAIVIKKGTFEKKEKGVIEETNEIGKEEAIKLICENIDSKDIIISTTGKTSRELFEYRIHNNEKTRDFYTVGSMGCSASIALGIALQKSQKNVFVFDGDGAVIMQMGSLSTIGHYKPNNLTHIIFDNQTYDSTGGQKTVSSTVDFEKIALACGYKTTKKVSKIEELQSIIDDLKNFEKPSLILIKVKKGSRKNLGRPTKTPLENKKEFMEFIK